MTERNRSTPGVARNAISNWFAFVFVACVSFFLSPYIVKNLGQSGYGVWSLLGSIVGTFGLLDFGVRGAVMRYIARHHACMEDVESSRIASAGLVLFSGLGLLCLLISVAVALLSPLLFNIPAESIHEARQVIVIGGVTVALSLVSAVFSGIVTGLERFDVNSAADIGMTVLRAAGVIGVLHVGLGLVGLAWVNLAVAVIGGGTYWIASRRFYPEIRYTLRFDIFSYLKTILSFSVFSSILHAFAVLIYYSDSLVIAAFLPVSAVGIFAIAGNLCDYARQVGGALSRVMTPRVSALQSSGNEKLAIEVVGAARVATLATTAIAVTFLIRGRSFIALWMGSQYGATSGEVLEILAVVVALGGARQVAMASMMGTNTHRTLVPVLGFEAISNVVLSVLLVKPLGVVGVAIGTLVPNVLVSLFWLPRLLYGALGLGRWQFCRDAWLLPIVACLPWAVLNVGFEMLLTTSGLTVFFIQSMSAILVVPPMALLICFNASERSALLSWIKAHRHFGRHA